MTIRDVVDFERRHSDGHAESIWVQYVADVDGGVYEIGCDNEDHRQWGALTLSRAEFRGIYEQMKKEFEND